MKTLQEQFDEAQAQLEILEAEARAHLRKQIEVHRRIEKILEAMAGKTPAYLVLDDDPGEP